MSEENKELTGAELPEHGDRSALSDLSLPQEVEQLIEELPEPQAKAVQAIILAASFTKSTYRSPIPPPDILRGYNEVIPNGAAEILQMAKEQSAHRMERERKVIDEEQSQSRSGQIFGFILGILGLLITAFMAYTGHDTVAGIFGTTTIVGLVAIFVVGRKSGDKDLSNKK